MAMFHLHTAFVLEVMAFSAGLALLHFGKTGSAVLLRTAGWVLLVASLASAAWTVYYGIRYHVQGEFDHAYGMPAGCPGMDGPGCMGGVHGGMDGMHGPMGSMHGAMGGGHDMMMGPPHAAAEAGAPPPPEGAPAPTADEKKEGAAP